MTRHRGVCYNDRIVEYRVDAKISFVLERAAGNGKRDKAERGAMSGM